MAPVEDIRIRGKILINKSKDYLYSIFKEMVHLPQIFDFFENVLHLQDNHYRFTSKSKDGKELLIWNATVSVRSGSHIHWHSEDNQDLLHEGHITLTQLDLKATQIDVSFRFFLPANENTHAEITEEDLQQRTDSNLRRFKLAVEANAFPEDTKYREGLPEGFPESNPPPYRF